MAATPPTVFFYDAPTTPMVVPLEDGYSMTLVAITPQVAHLTISHETDGENIETSRFRLACRGAGIGDASNASDASEQQAVPPYRAFGSWMIAYHQDYDLYYNNARILSLVHPHCHEIIRI